MTRSNGLGAPAYVALAEFEPALDDRDAQTVLRRLEQAGIAAYLAGTGAGGDQLFVDSRQTRRAWVLLAPTTLSPALTGTDRPAGEPAGPQPAPAVDEAEWAALVEAFNTDDTGLIGRWPSSEDLTDPAGDGSGRDEDAGDGPATGFGTAGLDPRLPAGGWDRYVRTPPAAPRPGQPDADEEHYRPPDPPPLPSVSATVVTGWLGALGIPVALVVLGFIGVVVPTWLLLLAAGGFIYGLIVLFSMLRSSPFDPDDPDGSADGDNGAQV